MYLPPALAHELRLEEEKRFSLLREKAVREKALLLCRKAGVPITAADLDQLNLHQVHIVRGNALEAIAERRAKQAAKAERKRRSHHRVTG